MTAALDTQAIASPGPLTLSLIYAEDGWDWADATEIELSIEAGYLRAWLAREDSAAAREELKRVLASAKQKGLTP